MITCSVERVYILIHLFYHLFQAPPKQVPRTIENTRVKDETIVNIDDEEVTKKLHENKNLDFMMW